MLIESIPGEPLSFHVIPFDNPRLQYTLQVKHVALLLIDSLIVIDCNVLICIRHETWSKKENGHCK